MADKHGIVRLTRVALVRGLRLARAAEDARIAHEAAVATQRAAQANLDRQEALVVDARGMFARDPSCPQARLWLTHTTELMGTRAEAVIDAEADAEIAEGERAEALRAVARHQARSDRIAEHHRTLMRADHRLAEVRAELDTPVARRNAR